MNKGGLTRRFVSSKLQNFAQREFGWTRLIMSMFMKKKYVYFFIGRIQHIKFNEIYAIDIKYNKVILVSRKYFFNSRMIIICYIFFLSISILFTVFFSNFKSARQANAKNTSLLQKKVIILLLEIRFDTFHETSKILKINIAHTQLIKI